MGGAKGVAKDVMDASGKGLDRRACDGVGGVVADNSAAGAIFWLVMHIVAFVVVSSVGNGAVLGMMVCVLL